MPYGTMNDATTSSRIPTSLAKRLQELSRVYSWRSVLLRQLGDDYDSSSIESRQLSLQTPQPNADRKHFRRFQDEYLVNAFVKFNKQIFHNQLPQNLSITWSKTLTKTGGLTRMSHTCCVVELSSKVIDNQERLESVLLHELCHVAAFLIDNETKPPHGSAFRKWGARGFDKLGIEVTTCHSFDIHTPHKFKCTNFDCGQMYGRHSKKGINVDIKVCGSCNNPLQYVGVFDADGTPHKPRALNKFSAHVKNNFAEAKASLPRGTPHKDVMRALSESFRAGAAVVDLVLEKETSSES